MVAVWFSGVEAAYEHGFDAARRACVGFAPDEATVARLSLFGLDAFIEFSESAGVGISRARREGKQLGRPKRIFDREKARTLLQSMSVREAARQLGVSRGVIERAVSGPEPARVAAD